MREHLERLSRLAVTDLDALNELLRALKRSNDPRAILLELTFKSGKVRWSRLRKQLDALPEQDHEPIAVWLDPFLSHWEDYIRTIPFNWKKKFLRAKPCALAMLGRDFCIHLRDLHGLTNDAAMAGIATLTNLTRLNLTRSKVSDVSALTTLTNLKSLNLSGTPVRDASALTKLTNLMWLRLEDTQVTDISALAALTSLHALNVQGTQVSDEQVKALQEKLPNCKIYR